MKKLLVILSCLVFFTLASANAEAEETYYGDKAWTISFNMEVDPTTVNKDNIFIKNASGQTLNNVRLTLNNTNKQVYVDALDNYLPGQYTLHISNQVKSKSGNYLKTSTTKTFTIESYGPINILKESQSSDALKEVLRKLETHWLHQDWNEGNIKNSKGAYYLGDDLYVVTTGLKTSGGYDIRVNKIETDVDQTTVYLEDIGLPPGASGTPSLEYPLIIIKSTVPPNATLSFFIDGDVVPIKDISLSNPIIHRTDKGFTITFDTELDSTIVNKDNIFIKNDGDQALDNVRLTLDPTNKQVYVEALDDYLPGQYTLHISNQVKSKSGNYLKTSTTKTFTIESYGPITMLNKWELNDTEKRLLENWRIYFEEDDRKAKGAYYLGEDLYIVTTGQKSNDGYKIMINNIKTDVDQTVVYVEDIAPKPGVPVPAIIDYPFIIIKSTVPPDTTLSFLIDGDVVPIKDIPLSNP